MKQVKNRLYRFFLPAAVPFILTFFIGCPQQTDSKKEEDRKQKYELTPIPVPQEIDGQKVEYGLSGMTDDYKGVFIENRKVKLGLYAMGKHEVTYKLWKEVLDWAKKHGYNFANNGQKGGNGGMHSPDTHTEMEPVTMVSWKDCIIWCNAFTEMIRGKDEQCVYRKNGASGSILKDATNSDCDSAVCDLTKKGFRLPTEAEWEYAARFQHKKENAVEYGKGVFLTRLDSVSGAKKNWNDQDECKLFEWAKENSDTKTHPVGTKKPNEAGLYDMSGNVSEWCFDLHGNVTAAGSQPEVNPTGAVSGSDRVLSGGSYNSDIKDSTVGFRSKEAQTGTKGEIGFRCAVSIGTDKN